MIKKIPTIYPNELLYSYLSRTYMHSGVGSAYEFTKLVFERGGEQPKYKFVNVLSSTFKEVLFKHISPIELITKHTVFNFYGRFLTKQNKTKAINEILNGKNAYNYIHIPVPKNEMFLRYCPMCVKEDRNKYGECYFHIEHQIEEITICPHHSCRLKNTHMKNSQKTQKIFTPLEMCELSYEVDDVDPNSLRYKFTKYLYDFMVYEFSFNDNEKVCEVLSSKLDKKYFISARGKQKNLELIYEDINKFYKDINLSINKGALGRTLRGVEFNTFNVLMISFFERVSINELCDGVQFEDKVKEFDTKVKELYERGYSYEQIANILGSERRHIRNIIIGKYGK